MSNKKNIQNINVQELMKGSWTATGRNNLTVVNNRITPRPWQALSLSALILSEKDHFVNIACTAAGKTYAIEMAVVQAQQKWGIKKSIICVPQIIISDGFVESATIIHPETGEDMNFKLDLNLCDVSNAAITDDLKSEQLIAFLKKKGHGIVVCSYPTLLKTFSKNKNVFKKLFLVFDEAHHVSYGLNRLGKFTKFIVENPELGNHLYMATATFFRADDEQVICQEQIDNFDKFTYPVDEYVRDCQWLQNISYKLIGAPDTHDEALYEVFTDANFLNEYGQIKKTIVYNPHVRSNFTEKDKHEIFMQTLEAIAGDIDFEYLTDEQTTGEEAGLWKVKRGDQWINILNFIDDNPKTREACRQLLYRAKTNKDLIDIICNLQVMREGANWPWAENLVIIGPQNSAVQLNQMVGRLLRDIQDKHSVSVYHIIPYGAKITEAQSESYLKHYACGLLMVDSILAPKLFGNVTKRLQTLFKDNATAARDAIATFTERLIEEKELNPELKTDAVAFEAKAREIIHEIYDKGDIEGTEEEVFTALKTIAKFEAIKKSDIESRAKKSKMEKEPKAALHLFGGIKVDEIDCKISDSITFLDGFNAFEASINEQTLTLLRNSYKIVSQKNAIARLNHIINTYKIDNPPREKSENEQEKNDGIWLSKMRAAKDGRGSYTWHPVLDEIAANNGWSGIFEPQMGIEELAIKRLHQIFQRYSLDNLPSTTSINKQEKSDAIWINGLRLAKNQYKTNKEKIKYRSSNWYPILDEIVKENNWEGLFDRQMPDEEKNIEKLQYIIKNYSIHNPPSNSAEDKKEKSDAMWLTRKRAAKAGKGDLAWYPILDKIAKSNGWGGIFDPIRKGNNFDKKLFKSTTKTERKTAASKRNVRKKAKRIRY